MFRSTSRRPSNPTSSPNLLHVIAWCAMFSSHCYIKEKEGETPPPSLFKCFLWLPRITASRTRTRTFYMLLQEEGWVLVSKAWSVHRKLKLTIEKNSSAIPAGTQTQDLSITDWRSPALYNGAILCPRPTLQSYWFKQFYYWKHVNRQ